MESETQISIESAQCQRITWKIPRFLQLPRENRNIISSGFYFAGCLHNFVLQPHWESESRNHVRVSIVTKNSRMGVSHQLPGNVMHNLRCQSSTGEEIDLHRFMSPHSGSNISQYGYFTSFSIERHKLEMNRGLYLPDGAFTLICYLAVKSSAGSRESKKVETSDREKEGLPGVAKLQADYKQLLETGAGSDASFQVSDKEFKVHRCVLRARSEVFDAMFRHDTAEQANGRVVIEDLDPDCFVHFLEYLYTGVVGAGFSDDNVFGLYVAADKYGVLTLKSECVAHMRRTMSVDSFCDVVTLAQRHQEEDLLQRADVFFKQNLPRIIVTPKWQQFLIDNGKSANELLIKALVPDKTVRHGDPNAVILDLTL